MDDSSVAKRPNSSLRFERAEMLRQEMEVIERAESDYRSLQVHTASDRMAHASRQLRLHEIRLELDALQRRKAS